MTKTFVAIWLGQTVSLLGSGMTWFAFTLWAWQKTGQPTALSLIGFFVFLPTVLFTPLAGVFVDRLSRKRVMLFSDGATALGTLLILLLYSASRLEIWHVCAIGLLAGFFTAFQYPAYQAAITTLLPREEYARAQGMLGLSQALSGILAPIAAASLLGRIGMQGIMLVDLATFLFAFATLAWVHIPAPATSDLGRASRTNIWRETSFGFTYIKERTGLRNLAILFMLGNVCLAIGATLVAPIEIILIIVIVIGAGLYFLDREIYFYEGARLGARLQRWLYDRWAAKYDQGKRASQAQDEARRRARGRSCRWSGR
jgi:MFS family permease